MSLPNSKRIWRSSPVGGKKLSVRKIIGYCPDVAVSLGYSLEDCYLQSTGREAIEGIFNIAAGVDLT